MSAKGVSDRQVHEPALLGFVDRLEGEAGVSGDPIQKQVAVAGLAHSTGGDRPDLAHLIAVEDFAEPLERGEGRIDGLRLDDALRKRVAPEEHAAGRFLDDAKRLPWGDLRDDEADRAGAHVEDGHQVGIARLRCASRRHDSFCCPDEVSGNSTRNVRPFT